jgi:curved DNA-binding protein CbpA
MDPYAMLNVPKNFTIDQLKEQYKKIALKVHPDKGGSSELFLLVTKAFKMLVAEYNRRVSDKQYNELKTDFSKFMEQQLGINTQSDKPKTSKQRASHSHSHAQGKSRFDKDNFDIDKFNSLFDENKLDDVTDKGYKEWMETQKVPEQKKLKSFNLDNFNRQFDKSATIDNKNKYIMQYKEPEALVCAKKIAFTELGKDSIDDFSGDNMTKKQINYMDYRVAHTTSKIVDPRLAKQIKQYKNIDELEKNRSSISFQMDEQTMKEYMQKQKLEEMREHQRLSNLTKRDEQISDHYQRMNMLLLGRR